MSFLTTGLTLS